MKEKNIEGIFDKQLSLINPDKKETEELNNK